MFCISSSLVCDGINHCPTGELYYSDEDPNLCSKVKTTTEANVNYKSIFIPIKFIFIENLFFLFQSNGLSLWQQITREFFSKVYPSVTDQPTKSTTHNHSDDDDSSDGSAEEKSSSHETTTKRHRVTLTRGLSKYGPWGYLILGMLLCGGALLLCVLWGEFIAYTTVI